MNTTVDEDQPFRLGETKLQSVCAKGASGFSHVYFCQAGHL